MVNEPRIIVKGDFFTADLQSLYQIMCKRVFEHKDTLFMACCVVISALQYILYGTYQRKEIIDARIVGYHNGIPEIKVQTIKGFRIQRLKHKECGHTHALLFEWFIPYQKYSVRFVLIHLHRYFSMGVTIEFYCLENDIPVTTFRKWLQWMKENMPFLTEAGLVRDRIENKKNLQKWVAEMVADTCSWLLKSLSGLNLVLFQRRGMPSKYMNYKLGQLRTI